MNNPDKLHPCIAKAMESQQQGRISRREFLRLAALLGVSAATAATGSPWNFTSPTASTGRSRRCIPNLGTGCGRSAEVITRRTPGDRSAAAVSIDRIWALAQSSVTSLTCSASFMEMSARYCWWPVTLS